MTSIPRQAAADKKLHEYLVCDEKTENTLSDILS
jgi:hypothetical protein